MLTLVCTHVRVCKLTLVYMHARVHMLILACMHVCVHIFTLVCMHVHVYRLTLGCMHVCVHMVTLSCTHVHIHTHQSISQCNKDILTQPTPFREKLVLHLLVRNLVYSKLLLHLIFFLKHILHASILGTDVEKDKHALTWRHR